MADRQLLFTLFVKYATKLGSGREGQAQGVRFRQLRSMLRDLRLTAGIPANRVDAYVREVMLRADMDHDGALSLQEWLLWFCAEVAALPPLRSSQCRYHDLHGLVPLYNCFVRGVLWEAGWRSDAKRRMAHGMSLWQFTELLKQGKVISDSPREGAAVRAAVKLAQQGIRGERVQGGLEASSSMGYCVFVRALMHLAASKGEALHALLHRVMSGGAAPPPLLPPAPDPNEDDEVLDNMLMASRDEGDMFEEEDGGGQEACSACGACHSSFVLANPSQMEERAAQAVQLLAGLPVFGKGAPHAFPGRARMCARNLRAAFHRYCAKWNQGPLPPANAAPSAQAGHPDPWVCFWGACACCFRPLSVMQLQAWLRMCGDSATVRQAMAHPGGLTPHRLQHVFTFAASVAGVYCTDGSPGVHDLGLDAAPGAAQQQQLQLPRGRASGGNSSLRYGAASKSLELHRHSLPVGGMRSPPKWAPLHGESGEGSGPPSPTGAGAAGSRASASAGGLSHFAGHRAPVLSLTFVQLLEGLRLLAEEVVGHPAQTNQVEAVLLSIVHDIATSPCPKPDSTGCHQLPLQSSRRPQRPSTAPPTPPATACSASIPKSLRASVDDLLAGGSGAVHTPNKARAKKEGADLRPSTTMRAGRRVELPPGGPGAFSPQFYF